MTKKKFSEDFKKSVVATLLESDISVSELAKQNNIRPNVLYRWKDKYQVTEAGKMAKKIDPKDLEILRLKKENAEIKMERDILKKSVAIFSKL